MGAAPAAPEKPRWAPAAAAEEAPTAATTAPASTAITQRKTLKISRPGGIKPGLKKPAAAPAAKPAGNEAVADIPDVADIPEMSAVVPAHAPAANNTGNPADVPTGVAILGLVVQVAACAAIAFLGWCLYQDTQLPMFCGGLQP